MAAMVYNIIKVVIKSIKVVISGELSTQFSTQCGKLPQRKRWKTFEVLRRMSKIRAFMCILLLTVLCGKVV